MDRVFTYLVTPTKDRSNYIVDSTPIYQQKPKEKHISFAEKNNLYYFHHRKDDVSITSFNFDSHFHTVYEIFIHIGGRVKFRIDTSEFRLNPYDIIIVPPYTVHNPIPKEGEQFERYVFNIFPDFFSYMDCTEYLDAFENMPHLKYKIPSHIVQRSNISDILTFMDNEYDRNNKFMQPMMNFKIAELLYLINTFGHFEEAEVANNVVEEMIAYIDKNFDSISLVQDVTDNFFYSKNYLSKLFKKTTGITIPQYINLKKMENVEKLYKQGMSLTRACVESGFTGYNNFAYIYKTEFGVSPRKGFANAITKNRS